MKLDAELRKAFVQRCSKSAMTLKFKWHLCRCGAFFTGDPGNHGRCHVCALSADDKRGKDSHSARGLTLALSRSLWRAIRHGMYLAEPEGDAWAIYKASKKIVLAFREARPAKGQGVRT